MKLVMIYGPPASGKLTIANELAKITNHKVFHNHDANDLVAKFVKAGTGKFWDYARKIKDAMYQMLIKENINTITTYCYVPKDDKHIRPFIKKMRKQKVKLHFVRLDCQEKTLMRRVRKRSRKKHNKVKDRKKLKEIMKEHELGKRIPYVKSLSINTDDTKPKQAAKKIKEHYKL